MFLVGHFITFRMMPVVVTQATVWRSALSRQTKKEGPAAGSLLLWISLINTICALIPLQH